MVTVKIPASTANLGPCFDIMGMALEGLSNYVTLKEKSCGLDIEVEGEGKENIYLDENNIVYQAVKCVYEKLNKRMPGVFISIKNEIPLSKGLGSSAAAIVGGVVAANRLLENPLGQHEMLNLAAKIEGHSDNVAAAMLGKIVAVTKVKNEVICRQIDPPQDLETIVVIPDYNLSTEKARQVIPDKWSRDETVFNMGHCALLLLAFYNSDYSLIEKVMQDKLHQPYRKFLVPGMEEVFEAAKKHGAVGVALSGAGPSIVAFCKNYNCSNAQIGLEMVKAFGLHNIKSEYIILTPNTRGAEII